jgi:hypothetical protein
LGKRVKKWSSIVLRSKKCVKKPWHYITERPVPFRETRKTEEISSVA